MIQPPATVVALRHFRTVVYFGLKRIYFESGVRDTQSSCEWSFRQAGSSGSSADVCTCANTV